MCLGTSSPKLYYKERVVLIVLIIIIIIVEPYMLYLALYSMLEAFCCFCGNFQTNKSIHCEDRLSMVYLAECIQLSPSDYPWSTGIAHSPLGTGHWWDGKK